MIPHLARAWDVSATWTNDLELRNGTVFANEATANAAWYVSLPSDTVVAAKNSWGTTIRVELGRRSVIAPVWDRGPWNISDNYWESSRAIYSNLASPHIPDWPGPVEGWPEHRPGKDHRWAPHRQ